MTRQINDDRPIASGLAPASNLAGRFSQQFLESQISFFFMPMTRIKTSAHSYTVIAAAPPGDALVSCLHVRRSAMTALTFPSMK